MKTVSGVITTVIICTCVVGLIRTPVCQTRVLSPLTINSLIWCLLLTLRTNPHNAEATKAHALCCDGIKNCRCLKGRRRREFKDRVDIADMAKFKDTVDIADMAKFERSIVRKKRRKLDDDKYMGSITFIVRLMHSIVQT